MNPAESLYEFAAGVMSAPVRGQITIDSHTLNADILATGSNVSIAVAHGLNDPAVERAFDKQLGKRSEEQQWGNFEIKLSFGKHKREDALAGWLRSAYLAIFSAWGFTYILRPQLNAVREQIREPDSQVLRVFSFTMPKPELEEPHIILIKRPESLAGHLAVIMGRHAVYLPGFHGDDLYDELARQSDAGLEGKVSTGMDVPWPERPRYELDFALSGNS